MVDQVRARLQDADDVLRYPLTAREAAMLLDALDARDRALASSQERGRVLMEILAAIANHPCEEYPQGMETCFYCHAYLDKQESHDPDCLWMRAKALAGTPESPQ